VLLVSISARLARFGGRGLFGLPRAGVGDEEVEPLSHSRAKGGYRLEIAHFELLDLDSVDFLQLGGIDRLSRGPITSSRPPNIAARIRGPGRGWRQ
jgi:hypothetical protein